MYNKECGILYDSKTKEELKAELELLKNQKDEIKHHVKYVKNILNNGWVKIESEKDLPKTFQEVILYREDAGVFTGYYGNLAESLSEMAVEQLYKEGVSEEEMWKEQFFYFGIEGHGILELDTEPTHWMHLPDSPKF
ncbi:MAG: hypothetical protein LC112_11240 [Flavobacteriales bacterium]|nr:hypothetical protein [Flavobacteriales bacterium]